MGIYEIRPLLTYVHLFVELVGELATCINSRLQASPNRKVPVFPISSNSI